MARQKWWKAGALYVYESAAALLAGYTDPRSSLLKGCGGGVALDDTESCGGYCKPTRNL